MNEMTEGTQDRLLAQLATIPACQLGHDGVDWFPPVDILEDDSEYLFMIDLPNVKPENIRVAVEGDKLVISGERPNPWQDGPKHLRIERPHGHFERHFALPENASRAEISMLFAESVLELRVRKVGLPLRLPLPRETPPRLKLRPAA